MLRHPSVESPSASLKPGKGKVFSSALRFTVLLGVILVLAAASRALPLEANLSREGLRDLVALLRHLGLSWGAFGPVAIIILGVLSVLLNVPTVLVLIAVSLIYGPITAIVLTLIYWAIACYCVYFIGQRLGHEFVARCFSDAALQGNCPGQRKRVSDSALFATDDVRDSTAQLGVGHPPCHSPRLCAGLGAGRSAPYCRVEHARPPGNRAHAWWSARLVACPGNHLPGAVWIGADRHCSLAAATRVSQFGKPYKD